MDFMRCVEPKDLVDAVEAVCARNREKQMAGWPIAWTDDVGAWFTREKLDTGERSKHPGEPLTWNGPFFQEADNKNVNQGVLRKWRRLRVKRPGRPHPGGKWEVGWSLPGNAEQAEKLAKSQELETYDPANHRWAKAG